jgi:single-strand DNA-binding protein
MNNCNYIGRLTEDPTLRYTPQGTAVTNLTIAVQDKFKNKDGEYGVTFVNLVAWKGLAEVIAEHTKKGDQIGVEARYQVRKYESNGQNRYAHEFIVSELTFCQKANSNSGSNTGNSNAGQSGSSDDPFANEGKTIDISDDNLPF